MKEDTKLIKDQIMKILADLYCDYNGILINDIQKSALFLYKNHKYGPMGTKKIALCLYKLDALIKRKAEVFPNYFADSNIYLGKLLNPLVGPFYSDIAELFQKTRKMCNPISLNLYLCKHMLERYSFIFNNKDEKLEMSFLAHFNMTLTDYFIHYCSTLKETYINGKEIDTFLENYYNSPKIPETVVENHPISTEELTSLFKEDYIVENTLVVKAEEKINHLRSLLNTVEDKEQAHAIEEEIFCLQVAIISRDLDKIENLIKTDSFTLNKR